MSRDQVGDCEARALVGDVGHLDPGDLFQLLRDQVPLRAVARGTISELAGFLSRIGDELLQVLRRQRRVHDQHARRAAEERDVGEIAQRIEREALRERGRDAMRGDTRDDQCVPVGRGLRDELRADDAARPSAVLDDEILLQGLAQPLRYQATQSVGGSARRERNDDAHRLGGPSLREGLRTRYQQGDEPRESRAGVPSEL